MSIRSRSDLSAEGLGPLLHFESCHLALSSCYSSAIFRFQGASMSWNFKFKGGNLIRLSEGRWNKRHVIVRNSRMQRRKY